MQTRSLTKLILILIATSLAIGGVFFTTYQIRNRRQITNSDAATGPITVTTRNDGMVTINGTPTFLFGFYYDSDDANTQKLNLVNDLNTIASAGFNVMHPVVTELNNTTDYRSQAALKNVWTIATFYRPALADTVTKLKDDPSIIMYDIADDFSSPAGNPKESPQAVKSRHDQIKAINPNVLTYGAAGAHPNYHNERYLGSLDVMGLEAYPIDNPEAPYKTEMEDSFATYLHNRQTMPQKQTLIALPQTFAWEGSRYPNAGEVRNMTYGALVARMNGIVYYTFRSATWSSLFDGSLNTTQPAIWNETKLLKKDIDKLTPAILYGTYSLYDSLPQGGDIGAGRIHAAFWQYQGKTYIVAINTATTSQQANINLPSGSSGNLEPLFPSDNRYEKGLTFASNKLTGNVSANAVHVYSIGSTSENPTATPAVTSIPSRACNQADLNKDGVVDIADYSLFVASYGTTTGACR
jgi:hypothetical protein